MASQLVATQCNTTVVNASCPAQFHGKILSCNMIVAAQLCHGLSSNNRWVPSYEDTTHTAAATAAT